MTTKERFQLFDHDYIKFELVEPKKSESKDTHAMLLLEELFGPCTRRIAAVSHDEVWFDAPTEEEKWADVPDETIRELVRCGVMFNDDGLSMFV